MPAFERHVAASAGNVDYKTKKAQAKGTLATSEQLRQRVIKNGKTESKEMSRQ